MSTNYRRLLLDMFQAAVNAAAPALCVPAYLPPRPKGRTVVVGAGKAAASMAAAVEAHWNGPIEGLVVTRYGHGVPCNHIEVVEASHPVPDEAGSKAARRILDKVSGLTADDLVLVLISGGGSALLALPPDGITLADKQAINRALLKCGAHIAEMNAVRKHLSAIKGGRLAVAAAPAQVVTLSVSARRQGMTFGQHLRDNVWPKVAMIKLVKEKVVVTDEDLKKGFEATYGEKVELRLLAVQQHGAQPL